jgi:hypothetical protein
VLVAEEVVDDLETLLTFGIISARNILTRLELALGVVAKEGQDRYDRRRSDVEGELVPEDGELLDELGQALCDVRAIVV